MPDLSKRVQIINIFLKISLDSFALVLRIDRSLALAKDCHGKIIEKVKKERTNTKKIK